MPSSKRGKSSKGHKGLKSKDQLEKAVECDDNEAEVPKTPTLTTTTRKVPTTPTSTEASSTQYYDDINIIKSEIKNTIKSLCFTEYFDKIDVVRDIKKTAHGQHLIQACYDYIKTRPNTRFFGETAFKSCHVSFLYTTSSNNNILSKFVSGFIEKFDADYKKISENMEYFLEENQNPVIWKLIDVSKEILIRDLTSKVQIYDCSCRTEEEKFLKLIYGFEQIVNIFKDKKIDYAEIEETLKKDFYEMKREWLKYFYETHLLNEKERQETEEKEKLFKEAEIAVENLNLMEVYDPISNTSIETPSLADDIISFSEILHSEIPQIAPSMEIENERLGGHKRSAEKDTEESPALKKSKMDDLQNKIKEHERMWKNKFEAQEKTQEKYISRLEKLEEEQKNRDTMKTCIIKMSNVFAKGFDSVTANQLRGHVEMTKLQKFLW